MSDVSDQEVESLFFQARERPPDQRLDFLKEACGRNAELFAEVSELLAAEVGDDSLLDAGISLGETVASTHLTKGSRIGRYKLLQHLGEGGFGVVYMAEQLEPVSRQVAIKIVKPGMDSDAVIARFEAERQALAMMDHPHIAKVLDGGTTPEGRPYFVMELVRGVSITEFCDKRRLTSKERLELFVDVCNAVQHAHQKGIIHRDLKPSNVMITLHDGKPIVKVIDFGVARAIHQKLTDKTLFTQYGQMLGTPQYMSPEQAEMSGLDVDTRSDIYSLGVLLYELLTGSPPLTKEDLREAGYGEIQRLICEQELQKPSNRVSTTGVQRLTDIAEHRGMTPERLKRQFQGELDWVVMKTLEKDRDRRYPTASDLAADIQRYLNDEVVIARPPSAGYRIGKYVCKHRLAVTTATTVLFFLLFSMVVSSRFAYLTSIAKQTADEEREKATVAMVEAEQERNEKTALLAEVEHQRDQLEDTNRNLEHQLYAYGFHRVEFSREKSRYEVVLERLGECPESLRDWEWGRLNSIANDVDLLGRIEAWGVPCFLPDSTRFTAIRREGGSNKIGVWDARSLQSVDEMVMKDSNPTWNALHPNGTIAAVATSTRDIIAVNLEDKAHLWKVERRHPDRISGLAFSPDGKRIASVCLQGVLNIWDAKTGEQLHQMSDLGKLRLVEFSPNGRYLAAGSHSGVPARIWEAESYKLQDEIRISGHGIHSISFSPDGNRLAWGASDGRVGIRDIPAATTQDFLLTNNGASWMSVKFSPSGRTVAVGTDRKISILDANTGTEKARLQNDQAPIWYLSYSSDGRFLASVGGGFSTTLVYDLTTADLQIGNDQRLSVVPQQPSRYAAPFSPDGKLVAAAGNNRNVELFDVQTGRLMGCLKGHTNPITAVSWSNDGSVLYAHERGGLICAWNWLQGRKRWTNRVSSSSGRNPTPRQWYYGTMALSRDDEHLYVGVAAGEIIQLDAASGKVRQRCTGHTDDVNWVSSSQDGRLLASASADKTVAIWDAPSFTKLRTLTGQEGNVSCVAVSPNGELVAATASDAATGTTRVWNADTGETVHSLFGPQAWTCAFSTSGNRLFTCGPEFLVVWDVRSGGELQRIAHHYSPGVSVSPDGKTVSTAGYDLNLRSAAIADPDVLRTRQIYREARNIVVTLEKQTARRVELRRLLELREDLTPAVRKAALQRIQKTADDPYALYNSSWKLLVNPTANIEQATKDAELAAKLVPDSAEYAMAVGLGHFENEALRGSDLHSDAPPEF